jgi:uncharacterized coiled-coil protein SlyX
MESAQSSRQEKTIALAKMQGYIADLENHLDELTARKKKVRSSEIENEEAEKLNTISIV